MEKRVLYVGPLETRVLKLKRWFLFSLKMTVQSPIFFIAEYGQFYR